jgi:hypothetical protein
MSKQTAVEWMVNGLLVSNYISKDSKVMNAFIKKAKAMEKEQIERAYQWDRFPCSEEEAEQYYKETYNK